MELLPYVTFKTRNNYERFIKELSLRTCISETIIFHPDTMFSDEHENPQISPDSNDYTYKSVLGGKMVIVITQKYFRQNFVLIT